ncbi:MAG: acyl-CoA thioesterase [Rhodoferax sp.]
MTDHPFDLACSLTPLEPGVYSGVSAPAYWNMVGPFGGMTAATALNAVLQHPDLLGEPIALTVNYAGALAAGPFRVTASPRRTNRSTQHWLIELVQTDASGAQEVMLTATAMTAVRRPTWGSEDTPMPAVPRAQDLPEEKPMTGVEWVHRYDMRFVQGAFPGVWDGRADASLSQLWMRDMPARVLDFCSLTAMADIFYPRIYLRRALRVPAGTVSMTVYFHAGGQQLTESGAGYLLGQAHAQVFRNGFFDQSSQLWNEAGLLLATTNQIVYYKN